MEIGAVIERAEHLARVDADAASDAATIRAALVAARQLTAWVDARQASLVTRLSEQVSFPESEIAETSKTSLAQALKTRESADTLANAPRLADQLGDGAITSGHIDVLTRCSKSLDDGQRDTAQHLGRS